MRSYRAVPGADLSGEVSIMTPLGDARTIGLRELARRAAGGQRKRIMGDSGDAMQAFNIVVDFEGENQKLEDAFDAAAAAWESKSCESRGGGGGGGVHACLHV